MPVPGAPSASTSGGGLIPNPVITPGTGVLEEKTAIILSVVNQIQQASVNPGGSHFGNATKNLNQYFSGTPASEYAISPQAREYLLTQLKKEKVDELESPTWGLPDARHLEDCMMYQGIVARIGGAGDDLTRVRRVFDWMVRQVQLVPVGSLGGNGFQQVPARPFDVLLRGLAVEEGVWSERGWLFLSLCRQLGLDAGLITYTPPGLKDPIVWCSVVLIDGKPYLFDHRIGLPIPDARGTGVATLEEALTNPSIVASLDLPGLSPYGTTAEALLASPSKIGVAIDSGSRYFSPRMKLLQDRLAGQNLTVLFRDPADQRDKFVAALGSRLGKVDLWELPMTAEFLLFTNDQFGQATRQTLFMFQPQFPLLIARMKELRGETNEAIKDYVNMRFAEKAMLTDKKEPMPPQFQRALDAYSTYFLGMCHLDRNDSEQAEKFFKRTLDLLPEPGRGQLFFNMFRWGAQTNLAILKGARGEGNVATTYASLPDPTMQHHGNLLRARGFVWSDPFAPVPPRPPAAPLPPPEAPVPAPEGLPFGPRAGG